MQAIAFRTPLIASGFQGTNFMRMPPVEKQREAVSTKAAPGMRGFISEDISP
jgi:hypothetical protein